MMQETDFMSIEEIMPLQMIGGSKEYVKTRSDMLSGFLNVDLKELIIMRNDIMPSRSEICKMLAYIELKDGRDGYDSSGRSHLFNVSGIAIRNTDEYKKQRGEYLKMTFEEFDDIKMEISDSTYAKIHLINNLIWELNKINRYD